MVYGDWTCGSCNFRIFSGKDHCCKCSNCLGVCNRQHGDWNCPSCGYHLFASKKYCYKCKYDLELERQRTRYCESGCIAIKGILKDSDNYFLEGCEIVYKTLRGVKMDKNNSMVKMRIKQLNKVLKNIECQIEKLKEFIEDDGEN